MGIFQERNGRWYARWREGGKLIRQSLKTADEAEAQRRWADIRSAQEKERLIGEDPEKHTANSRPWDLVEEHLADMERRKLSAQHIGQRRRQLQKVLDHIGAATMRLLTTQRIAGALAIVSESEPRTQNDYRSAIHAFFEWLVKSGRWHRNPVSSIRPVRELDEPKRRALSPDELAKLLETAPRHRAIIYRVASAIGLRRKEVRGLAIEQFDFKAMTVTLRAAGTKAKRWATIPITRGLVSDLEEWRANPIIVETGRTRPALVSPERSSPDKAREWTRTKTVSGLLPPPPRIDTFRSDLEAADIPIEVNGRELVFHSLRTTFITNLWRRGHSAAEVCRYGRLKDIKTAQRYYTSFGVTDDDLMRERAEEAERRAGIGGGATIPATIPGVSEHGKKQPNMAAARRVKKRRKAQ